MLYHLLNQDANPEKSWGEGDSNDHFLKSVLRFTIMTSTILKEINGHVLDSMIATVM